MPLVIFSALHLNGDHPIALLNEEIDFAAFLVAVVKQIEMMGLKLLSHHRFIDSPVIEPAVLI